MEKLNDVLCRINKLWSKADTMAFECKKREKTAKDGWTEEKCRLEQSIHKMYCEKLKQIFKSA